MVKNNNINGYLYRIGTILGTKSNELMHFLLNPLKIQGFSGRVMVPKAGLEPPEKAMTTSDK